MRWNLRRILTAAVLLAVTGVGTAWAQEPTREREQERVRAAQDRVAEAQRELEAAVTALREQESSEARRRLQEAIAGLQAARRELDRGRVFSLLTPEQGFSVALSGSGPKLGVYLSSERDPEADSIGAVLDRVVEDGPAEKAGLRDGDIIVSAGGESLAQTSRYGISPANKLIRIKNDLDVGDTLHVQYRRDDQTREADIVLEDMATSTWSYSLGDPAVGIVAPRVEVEPRFVTVEPRAFAGELALGIRGWTTLGWLDMELVTLDDDLGAYFGTTEGLLVVRAPKDNTLNLKSGDVILNVDGREPTSQAHLVRIMRSYEPGETFQMEIMRNQRRQTVSGQVPERDTDTFWRRERQY